MERSDSRTVHRVLVIDDDPTIHEAVRKFLCLERMSGSPLEAAEAAVFGQAGAAGRQFQFEVDSAFQGEHGLAKVFHAIQENRPYAVAFLDLHMPPGWTGIEVAPKLWVADPDLQIVVCTGNSEISWEEIFAKIGTSDRMFILKKPFDRMEVLQLAHNLADKWQARQQDRLRQKELESRLQSRDVRLQKTSEELHAEIMRLIDGRKDIP